MTNYLWWFKTKEDFIRHYKKARYFYLILGILFLSVSFGFSYPALENIYAISHGEKLTGTILEVGRVDKWLFLDKWTAIVVVYEGEEKRKISIDVPSVIGSWSMTFSDTAEIIRFGDHYLFPDTKSHLFNLAIGAVLGLACCFFWVGYFRGAKLMRSYNPSA